MVDVAKFDAWVPKDPERFTVKPYDVITDNELRQTLVMKGRERASRFSWENAARKTLELFMKFEA